ncbi:thiosulfate sulfurtransferase [Aspergillus homomorphus CBS 101889]|uniref:Thiosulfate sulfurtransferase n=1 Tax=Aspergillus homomorphus (strain CBS 101889) TaxID=1450537 RepID=A0A395I040_ASPHC|nr:thiosulfate sulfurtransferase [Aspergillus homomorphus CBS 101889]RAL11894.1 thiosulfate sulfurtransferase [Aspergillus homomorphus CBS 101889]
MAFATLRNSIPSPTRLVRSTMSTSHQARQQFQSRQYSFASYLVAPKELDTALKKNPATKISTSPRVVPLCAAWFMPNDPEGRKGIDVFRKHRIPGARFFDLDAVKDHESPYPHMLPTAETFAEAMSELGIRRDDEVVVYDSAEVGIFSAPRVGWTLRVFGHPRVHVLNNYKVWVAEGFPTETGEPQQPEKTNYPVPTYDSKLVIPYRELKEIAKEHRKEGAKEVEILDARSYGRWAGTDPEPRPGLSSGHIPGSKSLSFQELLDPETKTFLSGPELRKIFESKDIDTSKSIISSCGTGVTATIIETALAEAEYGEPNLRRVYDGSWTNASCPADRLRAIMTTGRKVFHCAVDETALTTNISEIKKWTTNGAITLIVPLYTLERLHALKRAGSQVAINAREAVRFLDRVTSGKDNISSERVALQGPMEQYENWAEAEKFFLPEFEEDPEAIDGVGPDGPTAHPDEKGKEPKKNGASPDDLSQMLLNKLNFKKELDAVSNTSNGTHSAPSRPSSRSSRTSPECANSQVITNGGGSKGNKAKRANGHRRSASSSTIPTVPPVLRPLLSALLWRLHQGPDASNAAKTCILITNDPQTQLWAQKFGIAVKNIHQLRTSIQYEEREFKNRCKYVEKTQAGSSSEPKSLLSYEDESDEDELVFVPRGRGKGASRGGGSRGANSRKTVVAKSVAPPVEATMEIPTQPIDPNSFSRSLGPSKQQPTVDLSTQSGAARGMAGASRNYANNRRGASRGPTRGNSRGRGKLWVP